MTGEHEEGTELEKLMQKKMREIMRELRKREEAVPSKPVKLTDETFAGTVQKHPLVVIDCWAPWCAPCFVIAPIIEELAEEYSGKILFGKLNVGENPKVARRHRIMSIPTLLVFKDGKLVDRIIGAMPRRTLELRIARHVQ